MIARSLIHEMQPKTTKQYADMIAYVKSCKVQPHIRHGELYLSDKWRIRKCYIENKEVVVDHKHAFTNIHKRKIEFILMNCLRPDARTPVKVLLSVHDTPEQRH